MLSKNCSPGHFLRDGTDPRHTLGTMADFSVFEIIMLVCFGLAWPFSIYKSWKSRVVGSKSFVFLAALFVGYVSGILHKIFYSPDPVIALYFLNGTMVAVDMALYVRNWLYQIRETGR